MSDSTPHFVVPKGVHTRWASFENPKAAKGGVGDGNDGRKRHAYRRDFVPGEALTLAEASGVSGIVRRIWVTIDVRTPEILRGLRIDCHWDGAKEPAVSAPFGDFFGHGLGVMETFEHEFFSSPSGESFNCCIPMPFRTGMRIVVTNESSHTIGLFFYDVDFTIGDQHGPDSAYLHAHWRRENPTTKCQDFEMLPKVTGRGRFLGVVTSVVADTKTYFKSWWGEGEVKVYLDGDSHHATCSGTGTEDYIGTGWGMGRFINRYQGCSHADREAMRYAFYRFHVPDPIYFQSDIRVTIQQMGCWDPVTMVQFIEAGLKLRWGDDPVDMQAALAAKGYGMFEREDDWACCAFFYLDKPTNGLPPLPPVGERL
jgi:hypothetical protein